MRISLGVLGLLSMGLILGVLGPCDLRAEPIMEPRRPLSPDQPLFLMPAHGSPVLAGIDSPVRDYCALTLTARTRDEIEALPERLEASRKAGIPVALFIRTWFPIRGDHDYDERAMAIERLEQILNAYPNVVAVIISEQFQFYAEQREYLRRALEVCGQHGVYCIYLAGWSIGSSWDDLARDIDLREAIASNQPYFVPMWEMNIAVGMYLQHSQLMGLWLSGLVKHWGANPQRWYWGEAGYGKLGEQFGYRYGGHGGMAQAKEALKDFPLYGQMVSYAALTGAEVIFIGAEIPPTIYADDTHLSDAGEQTLLPLLEAIVQWQLIPTRGEMLDQAQVFVSNDEGLPFVWGKQARIGEHSLRLDYGSGRGVGLAWMYDGLIPVEPGHRYRFSAWAKQQGMKAPAAMRLAFYNGKDWKQEELRLSLGDGDDWAIVEMAGTAGEGYDRAAVFLGASDETGTLWWDDISLVDLTTGESLLDNGDIEESRPGQERPLDWQPSPSWDHHRIDTEKLDGGLNHLWKRLYGMNHWAEFIPERGEYFPIVAWPPETTVNISPGKAFEDISAPDFREWVDGIDGGKRHAEDNAFILSDADVLAIYNSSENEDLTQSAQVRWEERLVTAHLAVHGYVILTPSGTNTWHVLAEGRSDRQTQLMLQGVWTLSGEPVPGITLSCVDGSTVLVFDHAVLKLARATLELEQEESEE